MPILGSEGVRTWVQLAGAPAALCHASIWQFQGAFEGTVPELDLEAKEEFHNESWHNVKENVVGRKGAKEEQ